MRLCGALRQNIFFRCKSLQNTGEQLRVCSKRDICRAPRKSLDAKRVKKSCRFWQWRASGTS